MVSNRKEIEKLIYDTFDAIDPSGKNTAKYRSRYSEMSDSEFEKHMKQFLESETENFILDIVEFEHGVDMDMCEAGAKVLGIPLMEYVYLPHLTMDKSNVIVSKERCLVGYLNIKRTQQLVHKKNGLSTENEKRNARTGQVTHDDKNARDSDIEATMLTSLGAHNIIQELHGPRSDDRVMRSQMLESIALNGYVQLEDLENLSVNKTTLNTINVYLLSMGIKSSLVSPDYLLPNVADQIFY
jgi:hypothetical protein